MRDRSDAIAESASQVVDLENNRFHFPQASRLENRPFAIDSCCLKKSDLVGNSLVEKLTAVEILPNLFFPIGRAAAQ